MENIPTTEINSSELQSISNTSGEIQQKERAKPSRVLPRLLIGFGIFEFILSVAQLVFVIPEVSKFATTMRIGSGTQAASLYGVLMIGIALVQFVYAVFLYKKQKNMQGLNMNYTIVGWIILVISFFITARLAGYIEVSVLKPFYNL